MPTRTRASTIFSAWAMLVCIGAVGSAQSSADDDPQGAWSDTVVVTASRLEQDERDVSAKVTVLDREAVEHSAAQTVDDFLRQVPGFSLFRRSSSLVAHPTSQGVSLRGIGPSGVSRTLVLLDGVPLNDPFGGWVYWSRVPLELVDRAEVVRGGNSNVWGNSALGGVVQLLTDRPDSSRVTLAADYGSNDTLRLDGMLDHRGSRVSLRAFGNDFGTDGYDVLREDQRGSIDEPAFGTHDTFGLDVGFDITDSFLLNIGGDVFSEERGNGTPLTGNETEIDSTKIRLQAVTDGGSEWRAGVLYQDQEFASRFSAQAADREFESPALDQFSVPSESLGLNVQWLRPFGSGSSHLVTAGGEYRAAEGQTNERFFFSGGNFIWRREAGGEQELNGFYLQDTWSAGDRWQVQLGARVDRWETLAGFRRETNRNTGFVRREALPEDRSETEVSPRFAVLFSASDTLNVRASAYESFRAPTINELFRPFRVRSDITEANSALVPETLRGFEIGIDGRGRKVRGGVTVFHNEVKDPIANVTIFFGPRFAFPCGFTPGGGSCRQRQNLDESRIQGVEADLSYRPGRTWELRASYLLSDTEVTAATQQPELEGRQIAQVPENTLVAGVTYFNPRGVDVALQSRYVDDQFEDDLNTRVLDSFVVFDLSLTRDISDEWSVFLRAENLLDEEIEVGAASNGLIAIGAPRLIHGGVRLRLGY